MAGFNTEEELWASFGDTGPSGYTNEDIRQARRWDPENDSNLAADMGRGLARGAIGLADALVGGADVVYNAATGDTLRDDVKRLGWRPDEWTQYLNDHDSFATQDARREYDMADGFVESAGAILANPRLLATMGAEQVPQLIPMVGAAGKAAKMAKTGEAARSAIRASAAVEGALTTGSVGAAIGDEYAEKGIDDDRRMAVASLAAGAGTAAIGRAMAGLGGAAEASIGSRIAGRGFDNIVAADKGLRKYAAGRAIATGAGEGAEEMLQSGQEQAWQNYGSYRPIGEGLGKAMGTGLVLGGAMGTAMHPLTGEPRSARDQYNFVGGSNPSAQEAKATREAISTCVEAELSAVEAQQPEMSPQESEQIMAQQAAQNQQAMQPQGAIPLGPQDATAQQDVAATQEVQPAQEQPQPQPLWRYLARDLGHMPNLTSKTMSTAKSQLVSFGGTNMTVNDAFQQMTPEQQAYVRAYALATKLTTSGDTNKVFGAIKEAITLAQAIESPEDMVSMVSEISNSNKADSDFAQVMQDIIMPDPVEEKELSEMPLEDRFNAIKGRFKDQSFVSRWDEQQAAAVKAQEEAAAVKAAKDAEETAKIDAKMEANEKAAPPEVVGAGKQAKQRQQVKEAAKKSRQAIAEALSAKESEEQEAAVEPVSEEAPTPPKAEAIPTKPKSKPKVKAKPKAKAEPKAKTEQKPEPKPESKKDDAKEDAAKFLESYDDDDDGDMYFSESGRSEEDVKNKNYNVPLKPRKYTDEETREYKGLKAKYVKYEAGEAGPASGIGKLDDEDSITANMAKKIINDYLDDKSSLSEEQILSSLDKLTARSLRTIHRAAVYDTMSRYEKHNKSSPAPHRWLLNAIDDLVTRKEAKAKDVYKAPKMSSQVAGARTRRKILNDLGVANLFMENAGDTTYEVFDISEAEANPAPITVEELTNAGVKNKTALDMKRRYDNTVREIKDGAARLMKREDGTSRFGETDEYGKALPMLKVARTTEKGKTPNISGWQALVHETSGKATTAEEQVAVLTKVIHKSLDAYKSSVGTTPTKTGVSTVMDSASTHNDDRLAAQLGLTEAEEEDGTPTATGMEVTTNLTPEFTFSGKSKDNVISLKYSELAERLVNRLDDQKPDVEALKLDFDNLVMLDIHDSARNAGVLKLGKGKKLPFMKFLSKGVSGVDPAKRADPLPDHESFLLGFVPFSGFMAEYNKGKTDAASIQRMEDILDAKSKAGKGEDVRYFLSAEEADMVERMPTILRKTANSVAKMIANSHLPARAKDELKYEVKRFVKYQLLPEVKIPKAGDSARSQLLNRYYTQLATARTNLVEAFMGSFTAGIASSNRSPFRWMDSINKRGNALTSNGGSGIVSMKNEVADDMRENFRKNFVAPLFEEEFSIPLEDADTLPLQDRYDFYTAMVDGSPTLRWQRPSETEDSRKFPRGRLVFSPQEEFAKGKIVEDFLAKDLWLSDWVKSSGVFTDKELKNSVKLANGQEIKGEGLEDLAFNMENAYHDYADRIKLVNEVGTDEQVAQKAIDDAEVLQEYSKGLQTAKENLDVAEKNLKAFLIETGSRASRVESNWPTLVDNARTYIRAIEAESALATSAVSNEDKAKLAEAEKKADGAYKNLHAVVMQLVTKRSTLSSDERGTLRGMAEALLSDFTKNYALYNRDMIRAQMMKEQAVSDSSKRMASILVNAVDPVAEKKKLQAYVMNNMTKLSSKEAFDIANTSESSGDALAAKRGAVEAARSTVRSISRAITLLEVKGDVAIDKLAMETFADKVELIMLDPSVVKEPQLFADAFATSLINDYMGFGLTRNKWANNIRNVYRARLLQQGAMPPESDTYYQVRHYKKELRKAQGVYRQAPTEANKRRAQEVKNKLWNLCYSPWLDKEVDKHFSDREVFNQRSQRLPLDTVVGLHKWAAHIAGQINKHFVALDDASKRRFANDVKKDFLGIAPAVTPKVVKRKAPPKTNARAKAITGYFAKVKGYTAAEVIADPSLRDESSEPFFDAITGLHSTLTKLYGEDFTNEVLSNVVFKPFDTRATFDDRGVDGITYKSKGAYVVALRKYDDKAKSAIFHEYSHTCFTKEAYDHPEMAVSSYGAPIGLMAKEIDNISKSFHDFRDQLEKYPLADARKGTMEQHVIRAEMLAQTAGYWLQNEKFRAKVAKDAPLLDEHLRTYLGDPNDTNKPVRPPLGKLGRKDDAGEGTSVSGAPSDSNESEPSYYERRGGGTQQASSGKGLSELSRRGVSGGVHQRESEPVVYFKKADEVFEKAAKRVPEASGLAEAVKKLFPEKYHPLLKSVSSMAKGWFEQHIVGSGMGLMFTSDLVDMVKNVMPSAKKYVELVKLRDAWINERQTMLASYLPRYKQLEAERDAINSFLTEASLGEVWHKRPSWMTDEQWEQHKATNGFEAQNAKMAKLYEGLSTEAKSLVDDILNHAYYAQQEKNELLKSNANSMIERIKAAMPEGKERDDAIEDVESTVKLAMIKPTAYTKPYVPLLREGSHAVVAKSKSLTNMLKRRDELRAERKKRELTDEEMGELELLGAQIEALKAAPNDYVVMFANSQAEANVLKDKLEEEFGKGNVDAFPREEVSRTQAVNLATLNALEHQINEEVELEDQEEAKKALQRSVRTLQDMYLMNLSEYHAGHRRLRRMKVAGFDKDMLNNFLINGYRESLFFGHAKFQDDINKAVRSMREESNSNTDGIPKEKRKEVLNEFMKREDLNFRYKPNEAISRLQRMTSVMQLLTSPAFYLQNLTQSFMMTAPYLSKDFGAKGAFTAIQDTTIKMMKSFFDPKCKTDGKFDPDKLGWMSKEAKQGLKMAQSRGLIDIGIAQDFGTLLKAGKFQEVTDWMSGGARAVEVINRTSAFAAAFDLKFAQEKALGNKDAVQAATDYACEAIRITHGDYSAFNEPRFFRQGGMGLGGVEKLITQFRKFQLIQLGFMLRLLKDSIANADPVTKSAARKALAFTLGTHFTMTGIKGTPFVATLAFILNGIFGDDDDTEEDTLRKFIGDKQVADLLIRGVPAYLGVDVSERIGAANMFSPFPYLNAAPTSREGAFETIAGVLGPAVAQFVRGANGISYMAEGDLFKGVEMMLPNGLTNAMRAYRYATEGYTTKNGTVTIPADEFNAVETFFQGIGLQTTTMSDRYRLQDKLIRTQERYRREENRINKEFREAKTPRERLKAQREYVALQKELAAKGFKPKPVTQLVKNAQRVEKDAKNAVGGVVSNNSNRGFLQYWASL